MLLDILVFLMTISLLCRYASWVLDRYIILSFDLYHVSILHLHVRTLLSDDESVVSVTRWEQQLEQTCLTICFFLLFYFVVVLLSFYFCLFVWESSCSIIIYMFGSLFWHLHCLSCDLQLRITPFGIFKFFLCPSWLFIMT
jgi:hypothetical protein